MTEEGSVHGAAAEVIADIEAGTVLTRFLHPETGEMVMELHLAPDVALDYAFSLSKGAYAVKDAEEA